MPWLLIHYVVKCELRHIQKKGERRWGRKDNAHGLTGFAGLTGLTGLASVSSREGEVKKSFEKRISRFRDLSGLGAGGPFSTPPHGVYPPLVEFGVRFFPKMELQSQLLAKQHCSKIMRGFSRWSNVVGNLNMTEFGARCIIFILFYVTGGHVVPESTVVRYIRQKLLSFMETTYIHTHTLHRCSCWSPVTTVSAKPKGTTRSSSLLHARNGQRLR